MAVWYQQFNGLGRTLGGGEGQGRTGVLQSMYLWRVGHDLGTEQQQGLYYNLFIDSAINWLNNVPYLRLL